MASKQGLERKDVLWDKKKGKSFPGEMVFAEVLFNRVRIEGGSSKVLNKGKSSGRLVLCDYAISLTWKQSV